MLRIRLDLVAVAGLSLALGLCLAPAGLEAGDDELGRPDAREDSTVTVKLLNYGYDPEPIHVRLGDTVRFVNATDVPHDAAFGEVPEDARLASEELTPFLAQKGDSHDVVIDERFVPGTYEIYCTPHIALGMEGKLIITSPEASDRAGSADRAPRRAHLIPPPPPPPPAPAPPSLTATELLTPVLVELTLPRPTQDSAN